MLESLRQLLTGLRTLLVLTVLLGIAYPVATWCVAAVALRDQSAGSLATDQGAVVGSRLLGQSFTGDEWFLPRPSAGDYDALASAGSNLGPSEPDLLAAIEERRTEVAGREGVPPADVPADALTASGSGLDPDISPAYAALQVRRVAAARGLDPVAVRDLLDAHTQARILGFLGQPRVNVLELNLALAQAG